MLFGGATVVSPTHTVQLHEELEPLRLMLLLPARQRPKSLLRVFTCVVLAPLSRAIALASPLDAAFLCGGTPPTSPYLVWLPPPSVQRRVLSTLSQAWNVQRSYWMFRISHAASKGCFDCLGRCCGALSLRHVRSMLFLVILRLSVFSANEVTTPRTLRSPLNSVKDPWYSQHINCKKTNS